MYNWGLSLSGIHVGMNAEDFLFNVEHLQQQYSMPCPELMRDFHRLSTEDASEWYWLLFRTRPPKSWVELRQSMERRFSDKRSDYYRIQDIAERKQRPGELFEDYFKAIRRLVARVYNSVD